MGRVANTSEQTTSNIPNLDFSYLSWVQEPVDLDEVKEVVEGLQPGSFSVPKETLLGWNKGFHSRLHQIGEPHTEPVLSMISPLGLYLIVILSPIPSTPKTVLFRTTIAIRKQTLNPAEGPPRPRPVDSPYP